MGQASIRRAEAEMFRGMEARAQYLGEIAARARFDDYDKFISGRVRRLDPSLSTRLSASVLEVSDVWLVRALALSALEATEQLIASGELRVGNPMLSMAKERSYDLYRLVALMEEEGWIRWYLGETETEPSWPIQ